MTWAKHDWRVGVLLGAAVGLGFWMLAHRQYYQQLDYTFVIATALLHGHLGTTVTPAWLNELVPGPAGVYYSVFPLGAVLSVLPMAGMVALGWLADYPVNVVVGLLAGGCVTAAYAYTRVRPEWSTGRRAMLALWLVLGTWFMTNLLFAGAWQLALGFAVLGQLGALYWSVVRPRPVWAGAAMAMAFGNRTEVLLVAPVILVYLLRPVWEARKGRQDWGQFARRAWPVVARFSAVPVVLGVATLAYNAARFGSDTDFGYERIPGILQEPWYQHGIFSLSAIGGNAQQMLWQGWAWTGHAPYWLPTGWGGSILLASPFLLLLARRPRGDRFRVATAWLAVVALTMALWLHGNPGGWQYSYRYAMILLPWFLVLLSEYLSARAGRLEAALWVVSVGTSVYATYLFLGTSYLPG